MSTTYDLSRIPAIAQAMHDLTDAEIENSNSDFWNYMLDVAIPLMDDDLREEIHADLTPCAACDFLAAYAARHEERFGSRFDF